MSATLLETMMTAALAACPIILEVYDGDFEAITKSDGSPVTVADHRAELAIEALLEKTGIPVLGEERAARGDRVELGDRFFVVDPLDGTKEFLKRNGEFTVNIALVENGRTVLGVVVAPALGKAYAGGPKGAFGYVYDNQSNRLGPARSISVHRDAPMRVVASRSHGHEALAALCAQMGVTEDVSIGSSLKFCLVAEGEARLYPRFTSTCEWDTAAGQAILEAAGGTVVTLDGTPLGYGKGDPRHLNPYFVAADDDGLARRAAALMQDLLTRS